MPYPTSPAGYDPAQNDARLAAIQARVLVPYPNFGAGFSYAVGATAKLSGDHPMQSIVPHSGASRVAVAWSATYRRFALPGHVLVADLSMQDFAVAVALQQASEELDSVDVKIAAWGLYDGAFGYLPGNGKGAEKPRWSPLLAGDARWSNADDTPYKL